MGQNYDWGEPERAPHWWCLSRIFPFIGASRSEPHTCGEPVRVNIWGEPKRAPHIWWTCARKYLYIYMFGRTSVTRSAARTIQNTLWAGHYAFQNISRSRGLHTALCNFCVHHCARVQHTLPRVQAIKIVCSQRSTTLVSSLVSE